MSPQPLQNYLRTFRRRFGLSQKEMAALLGGKSGTKISRYESFGRLPNVNAIWAYEVIFNEAACELFAGRYTEVRTAVRSHAQTLIAELTSESQKPNSPRIERKLTLLRSIVDPETNGRVSSRSL